MAFNSNVTLVGNLTRDPKIMGEGKSKRALLGLAVNEPRKDADDVTSFFNVTVFGESLVDNIAKSLGKGVRVIVRGSLETYPKEVEVDGETRTFQLVTVRADEVAPDLRWASAEVTKSGGAARSAASADEAAPATRKPARKPAKAAAKPAAAADEDLDDDLF